MMKRIFFVLSCCCIVFFASCSDDDHFSADQSLMLTFPSDTIRMDTVFSRVPSSTRSFWVHNYSSDGIRISEVLLERGGESGFRVNVDGSYLSNVITDLEVRKGDSLMVFVELTASENGSVEPQHVTDNLVFRLESGRVQHVCLSAYSWDALTMHDVTVSSDTAICSVQPIIVYGTLTIAEGATLSLQNTSLFFHDGAGMEINGTLHADSCLFRGDRLDRMFSYLPYDRVSGQWRGLHFACGSRNNILTRCEIRNPSDGILCDSTSQLQMHDVVVHNCQGVGLKAVNASVSLSYCRLSNTMGDCLIAEGGEMDINRCTLAQFFPLIGSTQVAFRFSNKADLVLLCDSTLMTGYAEDVIFGNEVDTLHSYEYYFADCILRTSAVYDTLRFQRVIWEKPADTVQGTKHFRLVDINNMRYDFRLDSISPAYQLGIGRAE